LRHILHHPAVTTVIPGMRQLRHVEQNIGVSDAPALPEELMAELRGHRWARTVDWE
jgi:aryl-alcohol dehydrogenase-like predicted oxidoreductase